MMKKFRLKIVLVAALILLSFSAAWASRIEISGRYRYRYRGQRCTLQVRKISNHSPRGSRSGTLRLVLWAHRRPYNGGTMRGYRVADVYLGRLYGGKAYYDVYKVTNLKRPPSGRYYYMTIAVSEYNNGRYRIADYRTFPRKQRF